MCGEKPREIMYPFLKLRRSQAGQGPPGVRAYICIYKYTDQVFQTGNHKVYIRTMIPHSYTYSDIFVTHYPKPYTKMLPYVLLGVDMFY